MAALAIPYIVPLILGMTFNAKTYSPGVSIFEDNQIKQHTRVVSIKEGRSAYTTVFEKKEIRDALNISGEMALKIKTGDLDVKGSGAYMKNDEDLHESSIIIFTFQYKSRVTSLGNAAPKATWLQDFSKGVLGTHYVSEVIYGVEMMAAVKFTSTNTTSLQDIQAAIRGNLTIGKNETANLEVAGNLSKIEESLKGRARMEISYYGTLPLRSVPNTIEGVKGLIRNFRQHVRDAGLEDTGVPMAVNLKALTDLMKTQPATVRKGFEYKVNVETQNGFNNLQDVFLRISEARDKIFSWSRLLPFDLSDEKSKKIGERMQELNEKLNTCYEIFSKVDLTGDPGQLSKADDFLHRDFLGRAKGLIAEVEQEVAKNAQVTTDSYVHWGSMSCPSSETELVKGYTVGSTKDGIGGMATYDCIPKESRQIHSPYTLNNIGHESLITGIGYGNLDKDSNPFKGQFARYINERGGERAVPCAKCHQKDASIISVFSATNKCPPSWHLKYTGYLMSGATVDAHTTQYICVDDTPPDLTNFQVAEKENSMALTFVRNGGSLPEPYKNDKIVPCAVCALRGGRLL